MSAPVWPAVDLAGLVTMLEPPRGPVSVVLDTDTANEIDDQFALVHAVLSETLEVEAVHAAPFSGRGADDPADGMEKSRQEILRVLELMDREVTVERGSTSYLPDAATPVESEAAEDLVARARADREGPLYVAAIGAPTNVASALLLDPGIRDRIVVVWLGGQPRYFPTATEFNLVQDLHASRTLFDSGVPLVQIPCRNVAEHLRTTLPELERHLAGRSRVGDYLVSLLRERVGDEPCRSKVIWDLSATAWIANPEWVATELKKSPILTDQLTYSEDPRRHFMRLAWHVDRDAIFGDLVNLTNTESY
ncbi:MAG: nucleoside hydrolase [Planctomycetota bacterium]|jgi:inosine-uridine nucleoside N-ribohydrolase